MTWTRLTGIYMRKRLVIRLRFGEPVDIHWLSGGNGVTHYWFQPNQMFAVQWWARLSPRRQVAGFAVVQALGLGDTGYRVPGVEPAVRVHTYLICRCVGKDRGVVGQVDALIQRIEREGVEPCRIPPAYYRAAGQSLRVGREPRRLSGEDFDRLLGNNFHAN